MVQKTLVDRSRRGGRGSGVDDADRRADRRPGPSAGGGQPQAAAARAAPAGRFTSTFARASSRTGRASTTIRSSWPTGATSSPSAAPSWTAVCTSRRRRSWRTWTSSSCTKATPGYMTADERADARGLPQARRRSGRVSTTRSAATIPQYLANDSRRREEARRGELLGRRRSPTRSRTRRIRSCRACRTSRSMTRRSI